MRSVWIAWALMLGFALTVTAGPASFVATTDGPSVPGTQDTANDLPVDPAVGDWDIPDHRDGDTVTIGLMVRWGYIDATVAHFEGRWRWNDDRSGGAFLGHWKVADGRAHGAMQGRFALPDDGQGRFAGTWNTSGSDVDGHLAGAWVRTDRGHGMMRGMWNFSDGRPGGVLAGGWAAVSEDGGGFRGLAIDKPTMDPTIWDGGLRVSEGAVHVVKTLRFETCGDRRHGGDDHILPRDNRQTVRWQSTTTVNWDGILFAIRVPKTDPAPTVTLRTEQASFEWSADELLGLHIREQVDRAGHEIEVRGFAIDRDHRCDCRDVAKLVIGMRWGTFGDHGYDRDVDPRATWDGSAAISDGGLGVVKVLSFERGDHLLRTDSRQTVAWESTTTTGWDGLVLVAVVPLDRVDDATFTLNAGTFSHTFAFTDLPGRHLFDVDGYQVEVRAMRG